MGIAAGTPAHRVLYVEDNAANRQLMRRIIERRGDSALLEALTAEQALELALREHPDLVLLDIELPGRDGYSLLGDLRAESTTAATPVIVLSAMAMPEDVEKGLQAGVQAYLTKPVDVAALLAQLEKYLGAPAG